MIERLASYWPFLPCVAVVYGTGWTITGDPISAVFMAAAIAVVCCAVALPLIAWTRTTDLREALDDLRRKYQRLCDYTDARVEEVEARTGAVERRVGMNRFNMPEQKRAG